MHITTDDDLKRIDSVYLGPKSFRLPIYWKFRRYYLFGAAAVVLAVVGINLGVPFNTWTIAAWLGLSFVLTRLVEERLRPGFGIWPLMKSLWQEIAAPRREKPSPTTYEVGTERTQSSKKDGRN